MHQLVLEPIVVCEDEELELLDSVDIPKHVAIIMDGNRRWAEKKGKPAEIGHWMGAEIVTEIVTAALHVGVKVLTVYAFSTENWSRSRRELDSLMKLFEIYLVRICDELIREGVRLHSIGDLSRFPKRILDRLSATKEATKGGANFDLVLALNYGGRDDIRRAALRAYEDLEEGSLAKEEFTENCLAKYLDTAKFGDPELLIRTGGEMRVSNFLLWQISYSEVVVMDDYWPDFSQKHLVRAINEFQLRKRRFGK